MFHQDNVQTARVHPPALCGTYEREHHESWGEHLSVRVWTYICSWLPTQLEHGKENILYGELETGRTVVAPCDARDCTGCVCESEQKLSVVVEHLREN
jgi:hypothetical protein